MKLIKNLLDFKGTATWLEKQKEGILIGTALAIFVYWKNINIFIPIEETGFMRLVILIFLFSTAGALLDSVIKPGR